LRLSVNLRHGCLLYLSVMLSKEVIINKLEHSMT